MFDLFSPVAKLSTLRIFLSVSAQSKYFIHQLDINNAFLNGKLQNKVYMEVPEGCNIKRPNTTLLLERSLYGLKEAPKLWNYEFCKFITARSFKVSSADDCIYYQNPIIASFCYEFTWTTHC